jgi:hypothetical protein
VAAKAIHRGLASIAGAGGKAADHLPPLAGDAKLLVHLAPRGRDRVFAAAQSPARQHPPAISVAVANEHDGIAASQDATHSARAWPPSEPPGPQQAERKPVRGCPNPPDHRHLLIVSAPAPVAARLRHPRDGSTRRWPSVRRAVASRGCGRLREAVQTLGPGDWERPPCDRSDSRFVRAMRKPATNSRGARSSSGASVSAAAPDTPARRRGCRTNSLRPAGRRRFGDGSELH